MRQATRREADRYEQEKAKELASSADPLWKLLDQLEKEGEQE